MSFDDRKLRNQKPQLNDRKAENTQLSNGFHSIAALLVDKANIIPCRMIKKMLIE